MRRTPSISPSRRSFRVAAALAALLLAAPAAAQEGALEIPPPILTIDQERLFAETGLGSETIAELEARAEALAAENHAIEEELVRQERELTDQRSGMDPAAFRELADAFDARVDRIRAEQDEKAREVTRARDQARQSFFTEIADVISAIVRERGALIVLDRRDVFLSAESIDITDEAIDRINARAREAEGR